MKARLITMPGSTSGMFIKDDVLPRLGIADRVSLKVTARGVESTNMLAAGESDIALGPVSELVNLPGVEFVGPFPAELQLVQVFTNWSRCSRRRSSKGRMMWRTRTG